MNTEVQARRRAEAFRRQHDLGHTPLGDLVELLIDTCGVDVVVMDADGAEHALTMRDPMYDRTVIAVATQEYSVRQRTSIAHELAHVLWQDEDLGLETSFGGRTPLESRADSFATHLPLPLAAVKPVADAARTPDAAVAVLVERFDVSPQVAAIQLNHFLPGRLHGEQHIGAGVTVGYGEDVEGVDALVMLRQTAIPGFQQQAEIGPIQTGHIGARRVFVGQHGRCGPTVW